MSSPAAVIKTLPLCHVLLDWRGAKVNASPVRLRADGMGEWVQRPGAYRQYYEKMLKCGPCVRNDPA